MALGMSNGDTWTLDAGIAKAAAAGSDPHKPSPLPSEALVRAYLDDGRVPGDTATRLPAAFDSLPAIFSVTAAGLIQRDSSTGVSRSAVQLSNASTFGFFPDLCLAGIVVYSVTAGSPAAHAGLRKGDVFASARSGTWVFRNMWDWTLFEAMQPTDEPFVFVVKRDGTSVELTATLGKAIH
jgi:S1-C subfamily serine protease